MSEEKESMPDHTESPTESRDHTEPLTESHTEPRDHPESHTEPRDHTESRGRRDHTEFRGKRPPPPRRKFPPSQKRARVDTYKPNNNSPTRRSRDFLSYKHWMMKQPDDIDVDTAKIEYERYKYQYDYDQYVRDKIRWEEKTNGKFFDDHQGEEWFREKYDPLMLEIIAQERKQIAIETAYAIITNDERGENLDIDAWVANHADLIVSYEGLTPTDKTIKGKHQLSIRQWLPNTVFLGAIPLSLTQKMVRDAVSEIAGHVIDLFIAEPRRDDLVRFGWVRLDSEENADKLVGIELKIDDHILEPKAALTTKSRIVRVAPRISSVSDRLKHDLRHARRLCSHLDQQMDIVDNPLTVDGSGHTLNDLLIYLRRVHFWCYYCGIGCKNAHDLNSRCGYVHLRDSTGEQKEEDQEWADFVDKRYDIAMSSKLTLVPPDYELTDGILETAVIEFIRRNILEDSECRVCGKRFMERQYVEKHIHVKHGQGIAYARQKAVDDKFYKNYVHDPRHLCGRYSVDGEGRMVHTEPGQQQTGVPMPPDREPRRRDGRDHRKRPSHRPPPSTTIAYHAPKKVEMPDRAEVEYGDI